MEFVLVCTDWFCDVASPFPSRHRLRWEVWRFYEAGKELPTAFHIDLVFLVEFSIYFWPCCVQWPISGFAKDRYWKAKISSLGMWSKLLVILEDCRRFFGVYKERSFYWSSINEEKNCSEGRPTTETRHPRARRRERWTGDVIRWDGGLSPANVDCCICGWESTECILYSVYNV